MLGCIADDVTGATDIASLLREKGLRVALFLQTPQEKITAHDYDVLIMALKTRTIPVADAVAQSCAASTWLRTQGVQHLYFKYCSTFDSTAQGNIGPVLAALQETWQAPITYACPAFPVNKRTVYQGHLFVGSELLSDSPMRDHPLTPMRDSSLQRVLRQQYPHTVGLIPLSQVRAGAAIIRDARSKMERGAWIVDALDDSDLAIIAESAVDLAVLSGGSALGAHWGRALITPQKTAVAAPRTSHHQSAALIAGSCSAMTRKQIDAWQGAKIQLDPLAHQQPADLAKSALDAANMFFTQHQPVLFYASAAPEQIKQIHHTMGVEKSAAFIEETCGILAQALYQRGIRRYVIAGGETSGAVAHALRLTALAVQSSIAPGVPWMTSLSNERLSIAFKSGNFGNPDFFQRALECSP
jgi:3-dehydrotetronate 4-kinase